MGHIRVKIQAILVSTLLLIPALALAGPEKIPPKEVVVGPQPVSPTVTVIEGGESREPNALAAKEAPAVKKQAPAEMPAPAEPRRLHAAPVDEAEAQVQDAAERLIQSVEAAATPSPEDPVQEPQATPDTEQEEQLKVILPDDPPTATPPAEQDREKEELQKARLAELTRLITDELAKIRSARARVSLVTAPLKAGAATLFEAQPDQTMVPASNAKLLTTVAATRILPGRYRFITQASQKRRGGAVYLWGTGDPLLSGHDIKAMARKIKARGVGVVRGVVVDDSYLDRRRLAPGFSSFADGSRYRPTSGAVNLDYNAVVVKVSAPRGRNHPRVDVYPPSDYVKVRKLVRFSRARKGKAARRSGIRISRSQKGSIMWLTISGTMGRRARTRTVKLAVYDPGLNAGWALRRALRDNGVLVMGNVSKGRRPSKARVLAAREHSLGAVLARTNLNSCNLSAENLVRAMGRMASKDGKPGDTWAKGLLALRATLKEMGISGFSQGNGSGLHRGSRITARAMVDLLQRVHADKKLWARMLPTLAVAGKAGTLARRMRGTPAQGVVRGKTGTLGNALALSGYVQGSETTRPLVFSLLVNGTASRRVRQHMDRIAELLARYARDMPLQEQVALR